MDEIYQPPKLVMWALAALRLQMLLSVIALGVAVLLDAPTVTSTNNYYSSTFGFPRELFPIYCFVAAAAGAWIFILARQPIHRALAMVLLGSPFIIYCVAATYFVYVIASPARTLVTGVIYWTAAAGYYFSIVMNLGLGVWLEEVRLLKRREHA